MLALDSGRCVTQGVGKGNLCVTLGVGKGKDARFSYRDEDLLI